MAIVFSISAVLNFMVTASVSVDALGYLYLLRVALNSLVIIDVACFNFCCDSVTH